MKTTHTPGPWHTSKSPINKHDQGLIASETTGKNIALCYDFKDAPLIAAAPELLATLAALVEWLEESGLTKTPAGGVGPFKYAGTTYSVVPAPAPPLRKQKGTNMTPKMNATQARELLLEMETPTAHLGNRRESPTRVQCLQENLVRALQGLSNKNDTLTLQGWEGILPSRPLRDWLPLASCDLLTLEFVPADPEKEKHRDPLAGAHVKITCPGTTARFMFEKPGGRTHRHGLDGSLQLEILFEWFTPTPDTAPADPWVGRARSKYQNRAALMLHYGDMAADGFRIHTDGAQTPRLTDSPERQKFMDVLQIARDTDPATAASVLPEHLMRAAKLCKTVDPDKNKTMTMLFSVASLLYSAGKESSANGEITPDQGWTYDGIDVEISINPAYLIDALTGLKGFTRLLPVHISKNEKAPTSLHITNGTREALICGKLKG